MSAILLPTTPPKKPKIGSVTLYLAFESFELIASTNPASVIPISPLPPMPVTGTPAAPPV